MGQSFSGAVLNNTNKPLSIVKDVLLPDLRKGQVLVKIAFSGVCHSQLMEIGGHRGEDKFLPHFLGHEASGYVVSIGPLVKKVKIGQPIILSWVKSLGAETGGCDYICESGNKINAGPIATFNEYAVVSENRCVPMPKGIPMDVAALFGCAALTGGGIVKNTLRPKKNSTLAIFGLGGIGVTALMAAKNYDLKRIIVVDINQSKLDAAIKFGADETINASKVNPLKHIRELTNHHGVDYSIDSAGLTKTIEQAFSAVKLNGGISVFASHPKFGNKIKFVNTIKIDNIKYKYKLNKIDFIKLDIEGAELLALNGAKIVLKKFKPSISLECEKKDFKSINTFLKKYNYTPFLFNKFGYLKKIKKIYKKEPCLLFINMDKKK